MDIYEVIDIGNGWDDAVEVSVMPSDQYGHQRAVIAYAELEPEDFSGEAWPVPTVIVRKKGEVQHKAFSVECQITVHTSSAECTEDVELHADGCFKRIE